MLLRVSHQKPHFLRLGVVEESDVCIEAVCPYFLRTFPSIEILRSSQPRQHVLVLERTFSEGVRRTRLEDTDNILWRDFSASRKRRVHRGAGLALSRVVQRRDQATVPIPSIAVPASHKHLQSLSSVLAGVPYRQAGVNTKGRNGQQPFSRAPQPHSFAHRWELNPRSTRQI